MIEIDSDTCGVFTTPVPPWSLSCRCSAGEASEFAWNLARAGLTVKVLRGKKMRDEQGLFDEFGAALQFPDYFGENWPATEECLSDLAWLPVRSGYVLVVVDADEVLLDTHDDQLAVLVRILNRVAERWSNPIALGEPWDRSAVPFHVVLQANTTTRWEAAGAEVGSFVMQR